jgi:hypothetical protein
MVLTKASLGGRMRTAPGDSSTNLIDYCRMIPLLLVIPFVLVVGGLILCFSHRYAICVPMASNINPRSRRTLFARRITSALLVSSMFKPDRRSILCRTARGLIADGPNEGARTLGTPTEAFVRIHWKLSLL